MHIYITYTCVFRGIENRASSVARVKAAARAVVEMGALVEMEESGCGYS